MEAIQQFNRLIGGKWKAIENVTYQLRGPDGEVKRLWQDNFLGRLFLRFFRYLKAKGYSIREDLAVCGLRIPFLLGSWRTSLSLKNLIVSAGKAGAASRINGSGGEAAFTYIGVGTGTTSPAAGNTTLETELAASGLSRANGTVSRITTSVTNDTAQVTYAFSVTGSQAVTEAGLFNASSSGTLLARQAFSALNVVNGDSLTITWRIQCS